MSASTLPGTLRPPELRARNGDPLEQRLSSLQLKMILSTDWQERAALWQKILELLKRRPSDLVQRLEAERLERARRAP
jgi:hypothetical protein